MDITTLTDETLAEYYCLCDLTDELEAIQAQDIVREIYRRYRPAVLACMREMLGSYSAYLLADVEAELVAGVNHTSRAPYLTGLHRTLKRFDSSRGAFGAFVKIDAIRAAVRRVRGELASDDKRHEKEICFINPAGLAAVPPPPLPLPAVASSPNTSKIRRSRARLAG